MPPRVTRSSARLAADTPSTDSDIPPPPPTAPPSRTQTSSRKRKAPATEPSPPDGREASSLRRAKRARPTDAGSQDIQSTPASLAPARSRRNKKAPAAAMSSAGHDDGDLTRRSAGSRRRQSSGTSEETSPHNATSRRKTSRKKTNQPSDIAPSSSTSKPSRKSHSRKRRDASMSNTQNREEEEEEEEDHHDLDEDGNANSDDRSDGEMGYSAHRGGTGDDDPFTSSLLGRSGGALGLSNTLRALSGAMGGMSGFSGRFRGILENLRAKDDPSMQLIALTELSEILLISNEDNLAGQFSPDQFVRELVALMQPNDFGEENPEMMLLACRCIANLMEALPAATASVVYGGAVPILCQKLLEIHYIDLAEQALSTLEKISVEFPSSIVREGGLTACLTYLEFFATSTQRTAVTTAANCCRNIPEEAFPTVRDVMPILLNVLGSSDQRVVEQASLCVTRIIDSFKYQEDKLEELVSPDLLKAILRLLLPGSTNLIGPSIHTQFLRVLAITARASPNLSAELLRMNVVDTLYQILTGVSPPEGTEDMAMKIDKNIIMQALIRTPRDQIFETLNVICELLPNVYRDNLMFLDDLNDAGYTGPSNVSMSTRSRKSPNDKRVEALRDCKDEVKRFAVILFPTLMHAYTSTVNLSVRQKVLTAHLKMLSNLDTDVVEDALRGVTYASHLASILTQQENPMLVTFALQAAELLLKRLEHIYRPQFYREGVMAEIAKLAERPKTTPDKEPEAPNKAPMDPEKSAEVSHVNPENDEDEEHDDVDYPDEEHDGSDEDDEDVDREDHEDDDQSDDESSGVVPAGHNSHMNNDIQDIITARAKKFMEVHENEAPTTMKSSASKELDDLRSLAQELRHCYSTKGNRKGLELFIRLAAYFSGDALESITSYELLTSGVVDALLEIFGSADTQRSMDARAAFLEAFMSSVNQGKIATGSTKSPATAFSVMVHKLQDLLSRNEHFEVITVHHNAFDSNRSSAASMLAKQIRLKLEADDDSGIPKVFRNIMVSIHAIATFRALDDYLRPRMSMVDRPRVRSRDSFQRAMAAHAAALAERAHGQGTSTPPPALPPAPSASGSSLARLSALRQARASMTGDEPETPEVGSGSSRPRRSSRRLSAQHTPSHNEDSAGQDLQDALECADEAPLSDDEGETDAALDAIVNDLDEDMDDDDEVADPGAVNLEVANTGKVTARTEDGTRISTPLQGSQESSTSRLSASARLAAARELLSTPSAMSRAMSYASALQQVPQDWHIEFSMDGQPISNDTTIYRAIHFNQSHPDEVSSRNIWGVTHRITFKRVSGSPPAEPSSLSPPHEVHAATASGLPPSLSEHPITASILKLMSILHDMNSNLDDILAVNTKTVKLNAEPLAQFVNTKLTAKLNRQLEEPLIVASNCLPTWSEDLARLYPFLFPFETRHLFLQSTSFGYSRSMTRWLNAQSENDSRNSRRRDERPFLGRLQRQKVRISRTKILESALKVMELYGSSPSILEVEYFEEVGTGLGPTLEFYSTVSKEFSKKKLKLWRENESTHSDEYAFGARGLFPAPMSEQQARNENGTRVLHLFKMLGKFVARSMLDSRIIDISFNPTFFRIGNSEDAVPPSLGALAAVDKDLANSLKDLVQAMKEKKEIDRDTTLTPAQKIEAVKNISIKGARISDLGLDFTLPGYPSIEMIPNGANTDVTIDNLELYIDAVLNLTLGSGVQRQVDAFRAGFSQVFPYSALRAFTPDELVMLFGRTEEDWSLETLMDSIKADHGFNLDSSSVRNLLHTMSELDVTARRDFLQFVTGSPKLPIGGFKSLTPMFTVVCKPSEPPLTSDDYLPSVMTCVNYLKMPDYSTVEVLKDKLNMAITMGQGAFHLS